MTSKKYGVKDYEIIFLYYTTNTLICNYTTFKEIFKASAKAEAFFYSIIFDSKLGFSSSRSFTSFLSNINNTIPEIINIIGITI